MKLKKMFIATYILVGTLTNCAGMDAHSKDLDELKRVLKPYKARILGIMRSSLDKPLDFKPDGKKILGTVDFQAKAFIYGNHDTRKTISFTKIEEMLDSDDQEFNIADIYDGQILSSSIVTEKDSLTFKKNGPKKPCCNCLSM